MSQSDPSQTPSRAFFPESVEVPNQFGTPYTSPGAFLPEPVEVQSQFGILLNLVQSLQGQVNLLSQRANNVPEKMPKLVLPAQYDGSAEDFDVFWSDINDYIKVKSSSFSNDFSKITFVSGLLKDSAKIWFQSLRDRSMTYDVPELRDFQIFSRSFKEHFMNREARSLAKAKLDRLTQGKTKMHKHLAAVESLIIQSGLDVYSDLGIETFIKTLNEDVKLDLRDAFLYNESWSKDYNAIKKYLKAKETNRIVIQEDSSLTVSIPNDPMDISSLGHSKVQTKWKSLKNDDWKILKEALLKTKCCLICRDYVEFRHSENSSCKYKGKSFTEIFQINDNSAYLFSLSGPSFLVKISLENQSTLALIDTGAQGDTYISSQFAKKLNLRLVTTRPQPICQFQGVEVDTISHSTDPITIIIQDRKFIIKPKVIKKLAYDVLLGFDFFAKHNIKLDCKKKLLEFPRLSSAKSNINIGVITLSTLKKLALNEKLPVYSHYIDFSATINISSMNFDADKLDRKIPSFLKDYSDVFDLQRLKTLPNYKECHAMPVDILPDSVMPSSKPYKISAKEEAALREALDDGLKSGIISISEATGGCPILFVKKPDGSLRLCVDFRALNQITAHSQAILPNIEDIINDLQPSTRPLFSKIDLKGAFHQLRIKKGDEFKTTFITKMGKYQYNVIPFGCKNAPGHFQKVMDSIFHELIGKGLHVYLDDILIYESDPAKHREILLKSLQILQKKI